MKEISELKHEIQSLESQLRNSDTEKQRDDDEEEEEVLISNNSDEMSCKASTVMFDQIDEFREIVTASKESVTSLKDSMRAAKETEKQMIREWESVVEDLKYKVVRKKKRDLSPKEGI